MNPVLKLQLGADDVARILGGENSELAIELRSAVVQEFARRHLKAIAQAETFEKAERAVRQGIAQEIEKNVGKFTSWQNVNLSDKVKAAIEYAVRVTTDKVILQAIEDHWKAKVEPNIASIVEAHIARLTEKTVEKLVSERLKVIHESISAEVEVINQSARRR